VRKTNLKVIDRDEMVESSYSQEQVVGGKK